MAGPVVGIDLGTTNTVVATVRNGRAMAIANQYGHRLIPSVVAFDSNGVVLVGDKARQRRLTDPTSAVYSVKRLLGRSWTSKEVQLARKRLPFQLAEGPDWSPLVAMHGQTYALAEISAFVLRQARLVAERALGTPVERAVITVPASFNDLQRNATKVAARVAGLETLRILNEPTAAAVAYGFERGESELIAVYDLGGGTFDITLLELSSHVFEVLATAGNTFLGGDDIDAAIVDRIVDRIGPTRGQGTANSIWQERVRTAAESLKRELSVRSEAVVELSVDSRQHVLARQHRVSMTRAEVEQIAEPIIDRTFDVCREALGLAKVLPAQIERVLLVGGATRMPLVRRKVEAFFGRPPLYHLDPDEVVALGAALQAEALAGAARRRSSIPAPPASHRRTAVTADRSKPPSIGDLIASRTPPGQAATAVGVPIQGSLPHAPSSLPAADRAERRAGTSPRSARPPDGPSSEGVPWPPRFSGPPVLVDVTPLTLSVETVDGYCDAVIDRNMTVPCERRRTFVTAVDQQESVRVSVGQGESRLFAENTLLGEVELAGIRPAPRGQIPIEVVFALDRDGILNVSAVDTTTRKATSATLRLIGTPENEYVSAMRQRQAAMRSTDG